MNQCFEHIFFVDVLRIQVIILGEEAPRPGEQFQSLGSSSREVISQIFIFCCFNGREEGCDVVYHLKMEISCVICNGKVGTCGFRRPQLAHRVAVCLFGCG